MDVDQEGPKSSINRIITEQSAEIVSGGKVFYNPVQEFNRDLSIAVINVFFYRLINERQLKSAKQSKNCDNSSSSNLENKEGNNTNKEYSAGIKYDDGLRILEALSATGLRSIRYAKEIAGIKKIIANDLSKQAVEAIKENIKHNQVEHLIEPSHADAMTLMYLSTSNDKKFDCIDLDPYGSPNHFLDGAIQSLVDGGLLLVTATDMAALAGNKPEVCYRKYGSVPLRINSCHEMALRILLHCIETHANCYGKYIVPLVSISADFYIRIFVRVFVGKSKCESSMSKQSMIYNCCGCGTYTLNPLGTTIHRQSSSNPNHVKFGIPTGPPVGMSCEHCGQKHHLGGPIWCDSIHDKTFVQELLQAIYVRFSNLRTFKRLVGMLTVVQEELDNVPLYYTLDKLCSVVKLESIPILKFRSALLNAGYKVSFSHASKTSIKTNAPASVLWDIFRCWNERHPVKKERMVDGTPVKAILGKKSLKVYNFDNIHPEANPISRKNALSRFQANPTAHWGPGTRATIMVGEDKVAKSFRNQNKKQKKLTVSHLQSDLSENNIDYEGGKAKQSKNEES